MHPKTSPPKFFIALLLQALLLITYCEASSPQHHRLPTQEGTFDIESRVTPQHIEEIFKQIQTALQQGLLEISKADRAHELWADMQHKLARHEKNISEMEINITESHGEAQLSFVREIARISAERERQVIMTYLAMSHLFSPHHEAPADVTTAAPSSQDKPLKTEIMSPEITIEVQASDELIDELE